MIIQLIVIFALCAASAFSQDPAQAKAAMQKRLGEVKQSMAKDQAQLKQYTWTETTEISYKGEVKKTDQKSCVYGQDGKVQKTAISAPPPPPAESGGGRKGRLKQKVVENKKDDMKEYMEKVAGLVKSYVPPSPQVMQASYESGKAVLDKASGSLVFNDYFQAGDKVTIVFDMASQKLSSFSVATYLDDPKDVVTLDARYASLADGTSYVGQSVLDAKAKQVQVKTTNSGHRKAGG